MKKMAAAAAAKAPKPMKRIVKKAMKAVKVGKAIPGWGAAIAVFGWGSDVYAKGPIAGSANTVIDAIPFVGMAKIITEMLRGEDFIPDR
jgi:hypothetical protein